MDWLTFFAESLKALGWPVAAVIIAVLFRQQFVELLQRLKKGKVGSAEFEFETAVREMVETAPEAEVKPDQVGTPIGVSPEPRTAILDAWLQVEDAAARLAAKVSPISARTARSPGVAMREIAKAGVLDGYHLSVLNELRHLRNQAAHAHDFNPSRDAVLEYVKLAQEVKRALEDAMQAN